MDNNTTTLRALIRNMAREIAMIIGPDSGLQPEECFEPMREGIELAIADLSEEAPE